MVDDLEILLPPLNEQRRIAVILDQADDIRRRRREALGKLEELAAQLVVDTYVESTSWTTLGNISEVQGGLQLSSIRSKLTLQVPYLRVANVYRNRLHLDEIKKIGLNEAELRRTQLEAGDILFVEGHGNPGEVGRCAVWDGSIYPCVHQNHLIRARIKSDEFDPTTLSRFLNSRTGRHHLLSRGKTTSGLNTITVSDVRAAPIPRIGRAARLRLAACLDHLASLAIQHRSHLAKLDALFASLQHRAFRGEL